MFFVLYKLIVIIMYKKREFEIKIKKSIKMKNYLSKSPEINFSTFS